MRSNKTLKYFRYFVKNAPDLTGKERIILLKRLKKVTLEKIGEIYSLTEGRIRQIERLAIAKMKSKAKQLNLFRKS